MIRDYRLSNSVCLSVSQTFPCHSMLTPATRRNGLYRHFSDQKRQALCPSSHIESLQNLNASVMGPSHCVAIVRRKMTDQYMVDCIMCLTHTLKHSKLDSGPLAGRVSRHCSPCSKQSAFAFLRRHIFEPAALRGAVCPPCVQYMLLL